MSTTTNRRIERFQNKLQQRINLADDEIARLNDYYGSVLAEITKANDQLDRFLRLSEQKSQNMTGNSKKEIAEHNAAIASMNAQHAKDLIELQEKHSREILSLQRDFEDTLKEVDRWAQSCIEQKTFAIDQQLGKTTIAIDQTKQSLAMSSNEVQNDSVVGTQQQLEYETDRIRRLEEKLKTRNQERLDTLLALKSRLAECTQVLEEVDQNHTNAMNNYVYKLESTDKRYEERVQKEAEKHEKELFAYQRQLENLKRKINSYQNQIERTSIRSREKIASVEQNSVQIMTSVHISSANAITTISTETTDINNANKNLEQAELALAQKENELLQARTENESLKREIARLRHEALIKERRASRQ